MNIIPIRSAPPQIPQANLPLKGELQDVFGRQIRDLRISITDRCNFRCAYCMPNSVFNHGFKFLPHDALLSFEEIERLARLFVEFGVRKIRITGGEPLLRRNVEQLIEKLAALPDVEITLTTNGSRLKQMAETLKKAGLHRITVSLDALDESIFRQMAGVDFSVRDVLAGIDAAAAAGLEPVKVNMVVRRGTNDDQILPMVRHFRGSGHILRFIEFMDVGTANGWKLDEVLPSRDIIRLVDDEYPVEPVNPKHYGEVAKRWRYKDGGGEIGVISSVTQAFCSSCTRMRLSPEGGLFTCLFAQDGYSLRELLRHGGSDAEICAAIAGVWQKRSDRYSEIRTENTRRPGRVEMHYIGG
ncbi:MAG: moaA [Burkholderiaceae bacterium]|nr:moaA [Burkholderiaceae bacterium]